MVQIHHQTVFPFILLEKSKEKKRNVLKVDQSDATGKRINIT
jgi:hypothetical protein